MYKKLSPFSLFPQYASANLVHIVWFQIISIPPPRKGFFLTPPHPSGNSSKASYFSLYFLIFQNPHPPGNSNPFWGGEYGYFLELHILLQLGTLHAHTNHKNSKKTFCCCYTNFTKKLLSVSLQASDKHTYQTEPLKDRCFDFKNRFKHSELSDVTWLT